MNTSPASVAPLVRSRRTPAGPRATLVLLRVVVLAHAVAVVAQPVFAGMYLAGEVDAIGIHGLNALLITVLALGMVLACVLYWRPGGGRGWPVLAAAGLLVAEAVQQVFGYTRELAMHIPLGVFIVALTLVLTGWVLRPAAKSPRPSRGGSR